MRRNNQAVLGFNHYLTAFMLFSVIPAFYVWHSVLSSFFIVIAAIVTIVDILKYGTNHNKVLAFILYTFVIVIYLFRLGATIFGVIEVLCVLPLFLVKKEFLISTYHSFLRIFAVAMAIGMVMYVMVIWFGIQLPYRSIESFNTLKTVQYYLYPFLVTHDDLLGGVSLRFMGMFDEPGVVGNISAILLLAEKFNLKKWENVVVLIAGVFSFSFFFYIICGVYLLLASSNKTKILTSAVIIAIVTLLYNNEIFYNILLYRFDISEGKLAGMNREHGDFAAIYERFRFSNDYWFGLGAGKGQYFNEGGSSYKQIIMDYGIIFFVIYILSYYLYAIKTIKGIRMYIIYSFVLLGTMYQRPFIGTLTYTFLMIATLYIISLNNSIEEKNDRTDSVNHSIIV